MGEVVELKPATICDDQLLELCDELEHGSDPDNRLTIDKLIAEFGSLAEAYKRRQLLLNNRKQQETRSIEALIRACRY